MKNGKNEEMKNDLVQTAGKELFSLKDDAGLAIMEKDAETYVDSTHADDIALPRLRILQSNCKQLKKSEPNYIKDAEEGDLFNTLTLEVTAGDEGVYFIPVKRRVVFLEWKDIDAGGGLIQNFGEDPTEYNKITPNEKGAHRTSDTTEIVKTYDTFGYIYNPKTNKYSEVLLSMAKSQAKKMKRFNALIRSLVGKNGKMLPEYAGVYKFTTVPEKNDTNSWFNYEIVAAGYTLGIPGIGETIYNSAKEFAKMIEESKVNVRYDQDETIAAEETEGVDEQM